MRYYLVRTKYGTELLWCGSTGERACQNAADATGLPIIGYRELTAETLAEVA